MYDLLLTVEVNENPAGSVLLDGPLGSVTDKLTTATDADLELTLYPKLPARPTRDDRNCAVDKKDSFNAKLANNAF